MEKGYLLDRNDSISFSAALSTLINIGTLFIPVAFQLQYGIPKMSNSNAPKNVNIIEY
jgi:hypothetical protein